MRAPRARPPRTSPSKLDWRWPWPRRSATPRVAEERLTYELERVVEERTTAWTATSATEQLNDARDELTDAQEQVKLKGGGEQRAQGFDGKAGRGSARRGGAAEMSEEHAHVMSGLEKLKRRLERHLKRSTSRPSSGPRHRRRRGFIRLCLTSTASCSSMAIFRRTSSSTMARWTRSTRLSKEPRSLGLFAGGHVDAP